MYDIRPLTKSSSSSACEPSLAGITEGAAGMPAILIVEDEADLREMLAESLEQSGYTIYTAGTVSEARKQLESHLPDLVLLDWMLPDTSGLKWLRQIRRIDRFRAMPVIMLTARGEVGDRVAGLDSGADDYIVKPFSLKELHARIRTQLRSLQPADQERLEIGDLVLDIATHRVMAGDSEISLGPTEFRLLRHFMANPDRVYSRSRLLDSVWGHQVFIEERTVDVHIRRLRKALEPYGKAGLIQTVRGAGYRLSQRGA